MTATRSSTRSSPPGGRTRTGSPRSSSRATRCGSARRTTGRGSPPSTRDLRDAVDRALGRRRPASCSSTAVADPDGEIVLAALRAGNVVVMVQPPRGFGANPIAIYHDPDLPPSHHYLAAYHWLREELRRARGRARRQARQPGMAAGQDRGHVRRLRRRTRRSATCRSSTRSWSTTRARARRPSAAPTPRSIDHLVPPMARAESYGDIARLEQLLDEHAQIAAMDPAKLPAIRAQIWTLIQAAKLDHDLGLDERPHDAEFDDFLLHVDGWLCEIKDAQIRDGLHVLGARAGRRGPGQPGARDPARPADVGRPGAGAARPARGARLRRATPTDREAADAVEARARALRRGDGGGGLGPRRGRRRGRDGGARAPARRAPTRHGAVSGRARVRRRPRSCPGWPRTTDEIDPDAARARRRVRPGRARAARRCAAW